MESMEFSFEDLQSCETYEDYLVKRFEGLKDMLRVFHADALKNTQSVDDERIFKRASGLMLGLETKAFPDSMQTTMAMYLQVITVMTWKACSFEQAMSIVFTYGLKHMKPETKALIEATFKMAKAIFAREVAEEAQGASKH